MKKVFACAAVAASLMIGVNEAHADYPPTPVPSPVTPPKLPKVGSETGGTSEIALVVSLAGVGLVAASTLARRRSSIN